MKTFKIQLLGGLAEVKSENYPPNHMPFEGTLLLVDQPSSGPPHGLPPEFEGRPILVPMSVAQGACNSLCGMGVNIRDTLDGHNKQNKIGVIEWAWLEGNELKVSGIIYDKDFPDEAALIKAHQAELGMSMETAQTVLSDGDYEGTPVAVVASLVFTGATILRKMLAAYNQTSLAANLSKEAQAKMEELLKEMQKNMNNMMGKMDDMMKSMKESEGKVAEVSAQVAELKEKVGAVDAKVDEKVTSISASLETLPKDGVKVEDITAAVEAKVKEIVHAEIEASKQPPVVPQRKTAPLARYGDVTGKDLEAAIHKSEGTTTDKLTALILAGMAESQAE